MNLPAIDLPGSIQNPTPSPDGKQVAFTHFRNGYNKPPADIYVLDLASAALTAVIADGAENVNAPGASWGAAVGLLWSTDVSGHDEINRRRPDGVIEQITSRPGAVAWEPAWARDGRSIVFESHTRIGDKVGEAGQIISFALGSNKYVPITPIGRDCRQPNCSADGRYIVYQEQVAKEDWRVKLYDIAGGTERELATGTDATFFPDSSRVVFSNDDDPGRLAIVPVGGGKPVLVGGPAGYQGAPSITRDGGFVICETSPGDPEADEAAIKAGTRLALIALPGAAISTIPASPSQIMSTVTGADIIAKARSYIGRFTDGPDVPMLAHAVGQAFPDLEKYITEADSGTSWCGIFVAYVMTQLGIHPPSPDAKGVGFMWVDRWLTFGQTISVGQEQPGDIALFLGNPSPHHVTFVEGGGKYVGGNQFRASTGQSDAVTEATFRRPDAIRRAPGSSQQSNVTPVDAHSEIELGAMGDGVSELQGLLGIEVDGEFGPDTDAAVRAYQASHGLDVDGVVGVSTWGALLSKAAAMPDVGTLPADVVAKITALARSSAARTGWSNGTMPVGCINGLAVSYAIAYRDLKAGASAALAMAKPLGNPSTDALAYYGVADTDPIALLRADFQLLFGSAMRESSGNYSEGRDITANNVTADTAEAGLFQQSWNSHVASPELPKLLAKWSSSPDDGLLSIFREGVNAKTTDNYGVGDGVMFQRLCKSKPLFAVYCAAVGQRVIRSHWGPIIRREAQMRPEVDALLQQVQVMIDAMPLTGVVLPPLTPTDPAPPATTPSLPFGNPLVLAGIIALLSNLKGLNMANPTPGQGIDLSKLFADLPKFIAVLQDPILQRFLSDQPVKLSELKTLPPEFLSLLPGTLIPPLLQAPAVVTDPAAPATDPASTTPNVAKPDSSPLMASIDKLMLKLSGTGFLGSVLAMVPDGGLGTPFGMGQAPTTNGTAAVVIPAVAAGFSAIGGWSGLLKFGAKIFAAMK